MFKTIVKFTDLQDNSYLYNVGDIFPRDGLTVSKDRIKELSSAQNKRGVALIEEVQEAEETEVVAENANTTDNTTLAEDEPRKRGRKRKSEE